MKTVNEYVKDIKMAVLDAKELNISEDKQLERVVHSIIADSLEWVCFMTESGIKYHRNNSINHTNDIA